SVGCNVFLTTESLPQLDEMIATLGRLPVDTGTCFETAAYLPTPRSRRNERLRPTLPDLAPAAARLAELADPVNRCLCTSLAPGRQPDYERWFGPGPHPPPGELADRYGDAAGLGVHLGAESVRYLWLDRAFTRSGR